MSRITAWSMWFIISIFYAYQYILRVMPNIMMNEIMEQYAINATTFGQFSGVYYIGYSLIHIPLGIMLDRYGPKKVIPACMVMISTGLLPILFTNNWIYPIMGRILIGMGSSAAILGTFKIIRLAFSEDKFTRMLSFSVNIGLIGAIYGGGPVSYMCAVMNYKTVVALLAITGIVLAIITYFIIPNIVHKQSSSSLSSIKEILSSPMVLCICLLSGLMVGPLEGFADVWGSTFLKEVYGLRETIAASLPSLIYLGMFFGGPILSFITEKTKSYFGITAIAGLIMMVSFIVLIKGVMSVPMISALFIVVGICCAYQIITIYKASTYVQENAIGLTTAVANMIIMFFGYFFHTTIGWIIDKTGGTTNSNAFIYGISVIPATLAIGSIGYIAIAIYDRIAQKKQMLK